jgi:hypothetical protein
MTIGSRPCLPNLLIIGARKAGTTSLHKYLSLHPQIYMSRHKELSFFDNTHRHWKLGLDWYKTNFDAAYPVNGEASPQYSRYPKITGVPERICRALGPEVKLIYLVRDPVDRIVSDYAQFLEWAHVTTWAPPVLPFHEVLRDIKNDPEFYLQGSSYLFQISQYRKFFPDENILIVLQERLGRDRAGTLRQIFRFLRVEDKFWSPEFETQLNQTWGKRFEASWFTRLAPAALKRELEQPRRLPWTMHRGIRRLATFGGAPIEKPRLSEADDLRLQRAVRDDVAALREFLGDPLPEWRPYS